MSALIYSNKLCVFIVPIPAIAISPRGPIRGAMVGSPLFIMCMVDTVNGVESNLVKISWKGPKGSYTSNSRVTIEMDGMQPLMGKNPLNTYNSTLQFSYLMEGDEGIYTCSVTILDTVNLQTTEIESLSSKQPIFIL